MKTVMVMTVLMLAVMFITECMALSDDDTEDILTANLLCQLNEDCANSPLGPMLAWLAFVATITSCCADERD